MISIAKDWQSKWISTCRRRASCERSQQFRETGVLVFATGQDMVDHQMPGYYLCLTQQVTVSVVGLIPPSYGIRATLTSAGVSRVVVRGDTFQPVILRNLPERMALTSATTTSTGTTLEPDNQSLLNPFEGSGFDTLWELRMPKAANPFDYNSIATVNFNVSMTALPKIMAAAVSESPALTTSRIRVSQRRELLQLALR